MTRTINWQVGISLTAIGILTIGPAILQGNLTNRWQLPDELSLAAKSLNQFPARLGAWEAIGQGDVLPDGVVRELGVASYICRVYRNRDSGKTVSLLLIVGESGPLVRHPPDICFASRANKMIGERRLSVAGEAPEAPSDGSSEFRILHYQPISQLQPSFSVAYAFSAGQNWNVPAWPRIAYGGSPLLYKAHIQAVVPHNEDEAGPSPIDDFVKIFVKSFSDLQQRKNDGAQ